MNKKAKRKIFSRKSGGREKLPVILIVTEGEKTEPNYFKGFPVATACVECVGAGRVTSSLVKEAKKLAKEIKPDIVWCVFDADNFNDFDQAIQMVYKWQKELDKEPGNSIEVKVAYSVECFETWILLHYEYFNVGLSRQDYEKKLKKCTGEKYKKNDTNIYQKLLGKQDDAIKYAKKLEKIHDEADTKSYAKRNPSSTVYKLVEKLNKFMKK